MPRKRHVSRNLVEDIKVEQIIVMPRKRHVSRNDVAMLEIRQNIGHASQEACE